MSPLLPARSLLAHDRQSVLDLQSAYADKIESFFTGLKQCAGDPCQVQIRKFGDTRTFIARGQDWLNRATLTGDESFGQLDEILAHFAQHGQRCHIEWNPGNCYRSNTWDDALGRRLLDRGFRPGGFRCVWVADPADFPSQPPHLILRHFGPAEPNEFLEVLATMEAQTDEQEQQTRLKVVHGEADPRWRHYIGYIDGAPCCTATLFVGQRIACLDWGQTLSAFRRRGCHNAMILRRLADARAAGCELAFAVTDVATPSAANLQRQGFRLAYNYIMLTRDPLT